MLINGNATKKTGTRREYVSPGLKFGDAYGYVIRARIVQGGKVIEDTRALALRPGDSRTVSFDFLGRDGAGLAAAR